MDVWKHICQRISIPVYSSVRAGLPDYRPTFLVSIIKRADSLVCFIASVWLNVLSSLCPEARFSTSMFVRQFDTSSCSWSIVQLFCISYHVSYHPSIVFSLISALHSGFISGSNEIRCVSYAIRFVLKESYSHLNVWRPWIVQFAFDNIVQFIFYNH